jgi:hypothetical protein
MKAGWMTRRRGTSQVRARRSLILMNRLSAVRVSLARHRAEGVPFDVAWNRALIDYGGGDRKTLVDTKGAWRRAYEHCPAIGKDRTFSQLHASLREDDGPTHAAGGRSSRYL